MKEAELLGKLLPALPIVEKIREKYNIERVSPKDDQLKEILKSDESIDWQAIRQEIYEWVYEFGSEFLPPELEDFQKLLDFGNKLPPEPVFAEEGVTEWHKKDVRMLYSAFLKAFGYIQNQAKVFETVIDNCYSQITDNLLEYLLTGETRDIPNDWISNITVVPVFGETVIMALASQYADPKMVTEEFHGKLIEIFGDDRPNITQGNLETAPYLTMKLQGMVVKDIADEYIQEHRDKYPDDEESDEYRAAKRRLEDKLETNMARLKKTFFEVFKEQES